MRRAAASFAVMTAALATSLAGCGDEVERLTEAEFVAQGNGICADSVADLGAATAPLVAPLRQDPTDDLIAQAVGLVVENIRERADSLDELAPPEDLDDAYDRMLDTMREAADGLEERLDDDPQRALGESASLFNGVDTQAVELGLTGCARGGAPEG